MKIIVINPILFTHEKGVIPHVTTIKETMIYDLCLAYHRAGHAVTLIAAADSLFTGSMEVLTAKER